ncbi:MAG: transposase [Acidobacteriia bacterium]|nr:transposase [Terriglobia bacterium]
MRRCAAGTELARAQVSTLRERLLKLGVWVKRSARRAVLHLPVRYPWFVVLLLEANRGCPRSHVMNAKEQNFRFSSPF